MYQQINATLGAPVYADATVTTAEELDYRAVHDMPSAEYYSQIDAAEYVAVDEDVAAATGGDTGNTGNDGHASATAGSEIIYAVAVEDVAGSSGGSGGSGGGGGGGGGGNPTGRGASWNPEDEASYEEMVSPTTTTPASPSTEAIAAAQGRASDAGGFARQPTITAVSPQAKIAARADSLGQGRADTVTVTIDRPNLQTSYGFGLGEADDGTKIISSVAPAGVSAGKLQVADVIQSINGQAVTGVAHSDVVGTITSVVELSIVLVRKNATSRTSNSAATLPAPTPTGVSYVNLAPNLCSGGSDAQPATTSSTAAGASYVNLAPDQSTGVHGQHGGAGRAEHAYVNLDPAAECAVDGAVEAHAYINLTPDGVPVEVAPPTIVPRQVRAVAHSNGDDNAESDSSGYDA